MAGLNEGQVKRTRRLLRASGVADPVAAARAMRRQPLTRKGWVRKSGLRVQRTPDAETSSALVPFRRPTLVKRPVVVDG